MKGDAAQPQEEQVDAADDLQFGDVQTRQSTAQPPPSPESDGHLATAVVAWQPTPTLGGSVPTRSVPTEVFVDLDAFLDMHQHAAEDTSVELGGLLLGRRGQKADGTPLVIVCDSLRAKHYRATRGSFKFTHETWADLDRRRAELPEATEVIGWYHTHPGWGVFLSELDVFICDHFFARPDDVALVIDPTSGDTGLFVRRGSPPSGPPRRLGSYRLYAHRKRAETLNRWVSFFSGAGTMSNPPAVFPGRESPPIIVRSGGDTAGWGKTGVALVSGLLGAQLVMLAALLLMLFSRDASNSDPQGAPPVTDTTQIREAVIDDLVDRLAVEGPEGASQSWRETALANEQLRAANLGLLSRIETLTDQLQTQRQQLKETEAAMAEDRRRLTEAEAKLKAGSAVDEDPTAIDGFLSDRVELFLIGTVTGVFFAWVAVFTFARRKSPGTGTKSPGTREPDSQTSAGAP